MTYTQLAVLGVVAVVAWDLVVVRTRLLTRRVFWLAYPIIVGFQLLTNGVLTGLRMVRYSGDAILGSTTPPDGPPPILGDGRILYAPVEDLLFGFALVVLTLSLWVLWGRRGIQREPISGPPLAVLVPLLARVGGRTAQPPVQAAPPGTARRARSASTQAPPATRSRRFRPTVARREKTS